MQIISTEELTQVTGGLVKQVTDGVLKAAKSAPVVNAGLKVRSEASAAFQAVLRKSRDAFGGGYE